MKLEKLFNTLFKCVIKLLLIVAFSQEANSQQYNFKNYNIDNGFPTERPSVIFQDKMGFLWVGTYGAGITRFDGTNFKNYTTKDGLAADNVYSIAQDQDGIFWIGTHKGVSKFDGYTFTSVSNELLENYRISVIFPDKDGNIWIGTHENGLIEYDGKIFKHYSEKDGLFEKKIASINEDLTGNIWLGTIGGGVIKFDGKSFVPFQQKDGLPDNTARAIVVDKNNAIWIGTDQGLCKFYQGKFSTFTTDQGLNNDLVYDLSKDKNGNLWIGTHGGISSFNGKKFSNYSVENGLPSNYVYQLFHDDEGNLWIGTDLPGITIFSVFQISYYTTKTGLTSNTVFGIQEDDLGNFWFATYDGGANKFEEGRFFREGHGVIPSSERLLSVYKDKRGNIWYTGAGGVYKYDGKSFTQFKLDFFNSSIFRVYEDSKGNIWFGSKGLIKFDGRSFSIFDSAHNFVDSPVFSIYEDSRGSIWVGTYGMGAFKFDGEKFWQITPKDGLESGVIYSIAEDKDGNIWFGTENKGVCRLTYSENKFSIKEAIDVRSGLSHNAAQSLIFDNEGNLWVGTSNGVCSIDVNTYNKTGKKIITTFGKNDGFINLECNQNAAYKDDDGFLWFGTSGGAIRFKPTVNSTSRNSQLKTYISNVRLFYKDINWGKYATSFTKSFNLPVNLKLPYDKNYLTFNFNALNYSCPSKIQYQFRLIPEDEDWLPTTYNNEFTYSNLSPGNYTFQVRASINGVWNSSPASFKFVVNKPFWQRWWFYSALILTLLGIIYGYITSHTRRLKVIQKDLEIKVHQRTSQLEEQNNKLQEAYKIIEEKNSEITDSIRYAKNIQEAILPPMHLLKNFLPDSFVFFMPKDIVSGDFYWLAQTESKVVVAAVDCTGHGVPGAFMSFVGFNLLNQIVNQAGITVPAEILNNLNISLNESLRNTLRRSDIKDGMDIAICTIDIKKKIAEFSGAYNPLYHIRDKNLTIYPADRFPVGSFMEMTHKKFTNHCIKLERGDSIYIFTDGFADQFGGPDDKKFMYSRFRNLLTNIQDLNMSEQKLVLYKEFQNWKGVNEQVDDILVIGIRV